MLETLLFLEDDNSEDANQNVFKLLAFLFPVFQTIQIVLPNVNQIVESIL